MRILHIDTELTWRGGENQLRLLLNGLKGTDLENHVALRPGSLAIERLRGLAQQIVLPMRGGFDLFAARQLANYCKSKKIDIIDAHTSNGHAMGLLLRHFCPGTRLVVHRRVDYAPHRGLLNRRKYLSPKVDRYVAISHAIANVLTQYGVPAARLEVVRSAIDPAIYEHIDAVQARRELTQSFGLDFGTMLIGNASALTDQKGYEVLLDAAAILKRQGENFHVFIAGDGPLMSDLECQRQTLGLAHHVTFLGFIKEVPTFLRALDILAVPSHFEGLGTILLDGLAAGLAVAATAVGGIPEVIMPEVTGLLSADGDADGLALNLTRLLHEHDLRKRLNAAGRAHIDAEFSVGAMIAGNLDVYQKLLRS
ncbi:MAG: glycosyltransferase family 4 protein [Deltaproteobacteria bacterium]|nr:glycosyltransferase family 4 protein [Deltaproteobacteria bacterium]